MIGMADSFDLGEPPQPAAKADTAYRVLARKYRPQTFSELIGQDAMVTTLGNAIRRGRLAHAFLLTGVRGGGTTPTAGPIGNAPDLDRAADRQGAELHRPGRAGWADDRPVRRLRTMRRDRGRAAHRRGRDGRR